ncbi:MAG: hypothetical protein GX817_05230 [Elusimicrobia bacterium]|nr:hypothetical protein [Elusimicrobiota bacterium]
MKTPAVKTLLILFLLTVIPTLAQAVVLDIGNELSMEYRSHKRTGADDSIEAVQRARFYLTGFMNNNIKVSLGINSTGILNSTQTLIYYEGREIENMRPFLDTAFVEADQIAGLPIRVRAGLQPIKWGGGVLINDMGMGFPALSIMGKEFFLGISAEAYRTWTRNEIRDIPDITGTGFRAFRSIGPGILELNYSFEDYVAPSPDPLKDPALVERNIYGGSYSQELKNGIEYSFFGYLMEGTKREDSFKGHALGAYGKFEGLVEPIGRGGTWIRYLLGSGDDDKLDDDKSFMPIVGGISTPLIGDYYGRMREFLIIDGITSGRASRSNSIADISILSYSIYANILDEVSVNMVRTTFKEHSSDLPLGGLLTFGGSYSYGIIDIELNYTVFSPETSYNRYDGDRDTKVLTALLNVRF